MPPNKLISLKSNSERDTLCDSIFAQRLANAPSSDTWPGESAKAVLLCLNHTAWLGSYWALVAFKDKSNTHPPVTVIVAKQKEQKIFFFGWQTSQSSRVIASVVRRGSLMEQETSKAATAIGEVFLAVFLPGKPGWCWHDKDWDLLESDDPLFLNLWLAVFTSQGLFLTCSTSETATVPGSKCRYRATFSTPPVLAQPARPAKARTMEANSGQLNRPADHHQQQAKRSHSELHSPVGRRIPEISSPRLVRPLKRSSPPTSHPDLPFLPNTHPHLTTQPRRYGTHTLYLFAQVSHSLFITRNIYDVDIYLPSQYSRIQTRSITSTYTSYTHSLVPHDSTLVNAT